MKKIVLINSQYIIVSPSKKLTEEVLLCSSIHLITSTVVRIFCQIQQFTELQPKTLKELTIEEKKKKSVDTNQQSTRHARNVPQEHATRSTLDSGLLWNSLDSQLT